MNSVDGIKPNLVSGVIKFALLVVFVTLVFLYYYANCHSRMFLTVFGALRMQCWRCDNLTHLFA